MKRKSVIDEDFDCQVEESKEFMAGVWAAERALRNGAKPDSDTLFKVVDIPKYILNSEEDDVHTSFSMGILYALDYWK